MNKDTEKVSYCLGMSIAGSLISQDLNEINLDSFFDGLRASINKEKLKHTPKEANEIIQKYMSNLNETKHKQNKILGEEFLNKNSKKQNIKTTESGLQFEILKEGRGNKPKLDSQVTVHYHGTLIDGTVFDSSVDRGNPATFGVNQVIKGWTEALQLMNEGAKYRLYIPQELAYGANPHPGGPIKPYMTLIFDVELIKIN